MAIGLYIGVLIFFSWWSAGYCFSTMMYSGDICTQLNGIAVNSNIPSYGNGTSYYINCFSAVIFNKIIFFR